MTHCTMDDLTALAAREGSVWARRHVETCGGCRAELEALYQRVAALKALPALRPPRERWSAVRAAVAAERHARRRRWAGWSLALAAGLAAAVVFRPFTPAAARADELAQAQRASAALEAQLHALDPSGRVESGRAAALAADLEDRIAAVDGELARLGAAGVPERADTVLSLWKNRVGLMEQLVGVRVTRASYVGL